jgi:hypothetical protein
VANVTRPQNENGIAATALRLMICWTMTQGSSSLATLGWRSQSLWDWPTILVGGVEDHVHLLARFGRTLTQAEWVKELKRVSNLWLKERGRDYADFEWQGGYADFSVSQSNLERVKQYIAGQEEHHRKVGFQDELRALLRKHEIHWDEKYVWD